jgi:hypothetical protein
MPRGATPGRNLGEEDDSNATPAAGGEHWRCGSRRHAAVCCASCPARTKCPSVTVAVTEEGVIPAPATLGTRHHRPAYAP